ncbi:MAG: hypothetical protein QNJ88_09670 [Acidimicrobiia bacterium]|nr:hypothetical protein [Acidimicrobiia bacterium]
MRDFDEYQQFRQWWLLALLGITALVAWSPLPIALISGSDQPEDPIWVLVLVGLVPMVIVLWVLWLRLETSVDAEAVHVRFRGLFVRRRLLLSDIERFEAVTYRPIAEYGGWGIRWRGRGKIAYSVSGKEGVRMELANGKEVLIGSQRADELESVMRTWVRR